jgi:hypothetical protein
LTSDLSIAIIKSSEKFGNFNFNVPKEGILKKFSKISVYTALVIFLLSLTYMLPFGKAERAQAHDPQNLMDDGEFINWRVLDADGVQAFLNEKHSPLRSYREGGLTAAQIIFNAARSTGLSPVVILSTLQKEESLIEGSTNFDYRVGWAMGYGICDGCDANDPALQQYRGFTKQVSNGAWQLMYNYNVYANNSSVWSVGHTMTIDGQSIKFANHATSALYRYTPHLSGNDSFNRIYNNYRTYRPPASYAAKLIAKVGSTVWRPGQKQTLYLYYQNLGTAVWFPNGANPMHIGSSDPNDRNSKFTGNNRWHMLNTAPVYRYGVAVFKIDATAPSETGNYTEKYTPIMEGVQWFGDKAIYNFNVGGTALPTKAGLINGVKTAPAPANKLDLMKGKGVQGSTTNAVYNAKYVTKAYAPATLVPGQKVVLYAYYRNTGNTTWYKDGANLVRMGTSGPQDRSSVFTGGNVRWNMLQASVAPNQVGIFSITITAPSGKGTYTEKFRPVVDGKTWMGEEVIYNWIVR